MYNLFVIVILMRWCIFMGYIDIHSHIIPGVDDGPETIELSKQMLNKAFEEGFSTIIATPHCSKGFRRYANDVIVNYCHILDQYAKEHISPDFSVLPGQEICYNESSLKLIHSGNVVSLANSNYILLEFETDVSFSHMLRAIREVSMSPYFVILAHIERYACLYELKNLQEIRQLGILTQMNYADIGGKWFQKSTSFCRKVLRRGMVDFLGTDIHDISTRSSKAKPALRWMHQNLDAEYIKRITETNAQNILLNNKGI